MSFLAKKGNKYIIQMIKYALGVGDVERALQRWMDEFTRARMSWGFSLFNTHLLHMGLVVIKCFPLEGLATHANIFHSQCPWATLKCFYYHILVWDFFLFFFFLNNLSQKSSEFSDNAANKMQHFIQHRLLRDS